MAPLRAAAPIYKDTVAEIPVTEIGKVHNDNERPTPVWNGSQFLNNVDQVVLLFIQLMLFCFVCVLIH